MKRQYRIAQLEAEIAEDIENSIRVDIYEEINGVEYGAEFGSFGYLNNYASIGKKVGNVDIAGIGQMPEFGNLAFQLGDRLLEFEERFHRHRSVLLSSQTHQIDPRVLAMRGRRERLCWQSAQP